MDQEPVLIVGAGVIGLTLGHALKKTGIPFQIFERDPTSTARIQGWGITLYWALSFLEQMLEKDILDRIQEAQVDPENALNDKGNFLFLDLTDCSVKFKIPVTGRRWRVSREKMRQMLCEGLESHVQWGKRVIDIKPGPPAELIFADGTSASGRLIVGIDGSMSTVRKFLAPSTYKNQQLPIHFTGVGIDMTAEQIKPLRDLDPLLFSGLHPPSRTFMWYATLETPAVNGTKGTSQERYRAQLNMSWPAEKLEDEVARTDANRLAFMKMRAQNFDPRLKKVWEEVPEGTEVREIKLADWECLDWDNREGCITLAGDAAHAMTMYRGEAANHGILDALTLLQAVKKIYSGEADQKEAIDEYETEMRKRTRPAVLMSRQACYDAHTWENLNENSAVLRRRAVET